MFLEYPVREEHARIFMRRYVGVITHDGKRRYGMLTGCKKGKVRIKGELGNPKAKSVTLDLAKVRVLFALLP